MINHLYNKIWVDCIRRVQSVPENQKNWETIVMMLMSMAMAVNFALILTILEHDIIRKNIYEVSVNIFPGKKLDAFIEFIISFLSPAIVLNYILIFKGERYKILLAQCKPTKKHFFAIYFLTSLIMPPLLIITWKLLLQFNMIK